jgi:hypothetical protein
MYKMELDLVNHSRKSAGRKLVQRFMKTNKSQCKISNLVLRLMKITSLIL